MEKIWYNSNRKHDDQMPNSVAARVSNGIAFLVFVAMLTAPIWDFIPWSATPLETSLGKIRFVLTMFLCHLGLLLWPVGFILFVNVLRQKRFTGLIHSTALIAFCVWQGWGYTQGVIWTWNRLGHWAMRL